MRDTEQLVEIQRNIDQIEDSRRSNSKGYLLEPLPLGVDLSKGLQESRLQHLVQILAVLGDVVGVAAEDLEAVDDGRKDAADLGQNVVGVGGFVIQSARIFRRLRADGILQLPVAVALPQPEVLHDKWEDSTRVSASSSFG